MMSSGTILYYNVILGTLYVYVLPGCWSFVDMHILAIILPTSQEEIEGMVELFQRHVCIISD